MEPLNSLRETRNHITRLEADVIPGVPGTEYQGDHFFVNVYLNELCRSRTAQELIFVTSEDAYDILEVLGPRLSNEFLRSVCVSFYLPLGETAERILRISIPTGIVPELKSSHDLLKNSRIVVTSEVTDIEQALRNLQA